jgi:hypothetical protein
MPRCGPHPILQNPGVAKVLSGPPYPAFSLAGLLLYKYFLEANSVEMATVEVAVLPVFINYNKEPKRCHIIQPG